MENKIKHIEMIQVVIIRMASNSFYLKGWAVTLIAGIFALAGKETDKMFFLIAYIPILLFWAIDSYYLLQERLYRELFDSIRKSKEEYTDFNMNAQKFMSRTDKLNFMDCILSGTELCFYLPLALLPAVIIIVTSI